MPSFHVYALNPRTGKEAKLIYTTETSTLTDENYISVVKRFEGQIKHAAVEKFPVGRRELQTLKIQLGLACNYSCDYCNQKSVSRADETSSQEADDFIKGMDTWLTSQPSKVEFWGGEPLVYWKKLKPLAESLRAKFPNAAFSIITNGALLDVEKVEWLDRLGFSVSISHDGPGQLVRGPDPLADVSVREAILDLYRKLAPLGRFSFNAMLNRRNTSRAAIQKFFEDLVSPHTDHLVIGEGAFIDAYDLGGIEQSLTTAADRNQFKHQAFTEIRSGAAFRFNGAVRERVASFVTSLRMGRPISSVGQKCGMDRSDTVAVDLRGNVLTCQNVSSVSTNPAGISHKIGHVSDLESVDLLSGTHWSDREGCRSCPMIHICKGSCLFLSGPLWEQSCDNAYADAVPIFAAGIEFLTGLVPVLIEGDFRQDRKDLFGGFGEQPNSSSKKPFPIPVVSA